MDVATSQPSCLIHTPAVSIATGTSAENTHQLSCAMLSVDDLDRLRPQTTDFKAERMVDPKIVADEMKENMKEYIRTIK
jgi:hypothetical protein